MEAVHYNGRVFGLRFAYLLALVVWLGGLIALGAVTAPAVFDVLGARLAGQGRVLAGAVFGEVLGRFHGVGVACGAVMIATLAGMALLGPRPRLFWLRLGITVAMLAVTIVAARPVGRAIAAIQAEVEGPIAELPDTDARKVRFGRLHGLSNVLLLAAAALGLALVAIEARDHAGP
jgi:hypothetical protein